MISSQIHPKLTSEQFHNTVETEFDSELHSNVVLHCLRACGLHMIKIHVLMNLMTQQSPNYRHNYPLLAYL